MIHSAYNVTATGKSAPASGERSTGVTTMDKNRLTEDQPAPTGMMAWVGFGCCVFALAALCICFASPYWLETWPNSENAFRNIGLWHVCFHNYMQFRDDSQQKYDGCWWLFDTDTKYYKLRQWLIPPWFISCQVLVVGCLVVEIATAVVTAMIFLHCCPIINHEYLQTYGIFASASMMFLVTMIALVVAIVFGVQSNDRYWLPRPDQNYLSWGFGFLIISAMMTLAAGVCLFMEAQKTYKALLLKEDEYMKATLEASTYPLQPPMGYPPVYDSGPEYGPAAYEPNPDNYAAENYGASGVSYSQPTYDLPSSYSYEKESRSDKPSSSEKPPAMGKSWQRSFDEYNDQGPGFV